VKCMTEAITEIRLERMEYTAKAANTDLLDEDPRSPRYRPAVRAEEARQRDTEWPSGIYRRGRKPTVRGGREGVCEGGREQGEARREEGRGVSKGM
jgi:hypothetical protein